MYPAKNKAEVEQQEQEQQAARRYEALPTGGCAFPFPSRSSSSCRQCAEECCSYCDDCKCEKDCCKKCKKSCCSRKRECSAPAPSFNALSLEPASKGEFNVRSDFRADAAFIGFAKTDESGSVRLNFKLPDSLTRYRVTAIANQGNDLFGVGKTDITTSLPVAVRPSMPRFLNYGDMCDLSYSIENQSTSAITLAVVCHVSNLRILVENGGERRKKGITVTVPALGRTEVRFPVKVQKSGTALTNVGIRVLKAVAQTEENQSISVGWSDAVKNEFKVLTPATTEAFATYGDISGNETVLQPIALPEKPIISQFGDFSFTTSVTALSTLVDSLIYLYSYPHECNEQRASKLLGVVCMKEIILQFYTPSELKTLMDIESREEIDAFVNTELKKLFDRQRYDGAFSYWSPTFFCDPFVTCHVALCFAKCKQEGYEIPSETLRKTRSILSNIQSLFFLGFLWPRVIKDAIKSFAYYVLSLLAETDSEKENVINLCMTIFSHYENPVALALELSPECAAWLAMAVHRCKKEESNDAKTKKEKSMDYWLDGIKNYFKENVTVDSGVYAHFITNYEDSEMSQMVMLHSNDRTDSVVLSCLMEVDKEQSSDIIQKLVRSILKSRNSNRYGRWSNTQDNANSLVALTDYFKLFENEIPDMAVNAWLVDPIRKEETLYLGEQTWKGRSREQRITTAPLTAFIPRSDIDKEIINPKDYETPCKKNFVLSKAGSGRLYYRIAMSYVPSNLCLKAMERGFSVYRTYEGVSSPEHVKYYKTENVWKVKAGELIRINITICNTSKRFNVALVDNLPAGFEAVNPELDTQHTDFDAAQKNQDSFDYWSKWFEHQNIRDERVEAYARILYAGSHPYSYIARATSIGSFVSPPTRMEEMYAPECFGRSDTAFVQVFAEQ